MGVKGLLPCLQSITRSVSLERYRGLTVAVDAMSWLHKGVFACDVKALAQYQRGIDSDKGGSAELRCVKYAMDKAELLRVTFGMNVLLVIDGDSLPSKKEENAQRREDRESAFQKALAAEKAGDSRAARRFYAQSCSVTHKIRYLLIQACKSASIGFIVAPYEADAQMARLAHTGLCDLVITEDSDILTYGCPRALFKVDFDTCQGQEIQLMRDLGENESLSFKSWTHDMFVFMCILSGCDYCKGVPGIGIKLAHKFVRVHRSPSKIFSALRAAGCMPQGFEDEFWVAFRTFRHQRVFCPTRQQIEPLFPIPGSCHESNPMEMWPFLGEYIEPHNAARIADGTLHPSKKIPWNIALNESSHHDKLHPAMKIQIHHRSSPSKGRRQESKPRSRKETAQEGNIWHALVYGNGRVGRGSDRQIGKTDRSSANQVSSNKDMFRFFSRNSKRSREDDADSHDRDIGASADCRPPLREIYVDGNVEKAKPALPPPPGHKDLPIHFNEYKSHLVGNTFKPISRKRLKRSNDGTKSTEVVQRIWEKSTLARTQGLPAREYPRAEPESRIHREDRGGMASFLRQNNSFAKEDEMHREDEGGIGSFSRQNNPFVKEVEPMTQSLAQDGSSISFTNSQREVNDVEQSCPMNETTTSRSGYQGLDQIHYRRNDEHDRQKYTTSRNHYYHDESSFAVHHGSTDRRYRNHQIDHHEVSQSKRREEKYHYKYQQTAFYNDDPSNDRRQHHKARDENSYSMHSYGRSRDPSHHNELKSLASGYTTVEESYTNESTLLEPAFPQELNDDGRYCDFEDSLQVVLTAETEPDLDRGTRCDDYDYKTMEIFQLFQSPTGEEHREAGCWDGPCQVGHEHNHSFDATSTNFFSYDNGKMNSADMGSLYDDELLMAFEEMKQL
jgi:exonuclease-1